MLTIFDKLHLPKVDFMGPQPKLDEHKPQLYASICHAAGTNFAIRRGFDGEGNLFTLRLAKPNSHTGKSA